MIEAVREGASRHEAAERFDISASSAVRWLQCWRETGRSAPKPRGGSTSPLEEHADGDIGSGRRTAGPDLVGDDLGAAQAGDCNEPGGALAFF